MSQPPSPIVELCIRILESAHVTHALAAEAGRTIVADSEFGGRFLALKGSAPETELADCMERYEDFAETLAVAFADFEEDHEQGRAELASALVDGQLYLSSILSELS